MSRNFPLAFLLALPCALMTIPAQAFVQRAFVSGKGDNANVATNCAVTAPCKTFAGALPVVAANGEIVAMDTAAYGSVTLTQSISLTAAPGVYAGISVFSTIPPTKLPTRNSACPVVRCNRRSRPCPRPTRVRVFHRQ